MKPEMRHMFMIQEKIYLLHFFLFKSSIKSLLLLCITIVFKSLLWRRYTEVKIIESSVLINLY